VLSLLDENKTIHASNGRSISKFFDDMKEKVERTMINYEKLHAKLHEKDNAILCVQMELGAVKAHIKFMSQLFLLLIKVLHITFDLLALGLKVDDD